MDAVLELLFTRPIGLLSLFTLLFIVGIGLFMSAWIKRQITDSRE